MSETWGIFLNNEPMEVNAYKCSDTHITGLDKDLKRKTCQTNSDFSKILNAPLKTQSLSKIVVICARNFKRSAEKFMQSLDFIMGNQWFYFCDNYEYGIVDSPLQGNNWNKCIQLQKAQSDRNHEDIDIFILILPERNNVDLYKDLKAYGDSKKLKTQFIRENSIKSEGKLKGICKKLLIQISAKIGHIPWKLAKLPIVSKELTMIVGISISHHKGFGQNHSSSIGVVATLDESMSDYMIETASGAEYKAISIQFGALFEKILNKFRNKNNAYPTGIIIYRVAVSDSQSSLILNKEVSKILQTLDNMKNRKMMTQVPKLIFLLANKKIEQRFFSKLSEKYENPKGNMIIDSGIVSKEKFEFYAIPHSTTQGLQSPVKYTVLYNNWEDIKLEDIYDLTNSLCYGYYNNMKASKLPAPLMYAQRLSQYLAATSTRTEAFVSIPEEFKNSLYFI